ncbi:hypothetical protein LTR08_007277 [Meristemomyces frigidus]|nr:hypothetical protein LTR08_007277 [Meristemomyces frigidus]
MTSKAVDDHASNTTSDRLIVLADDNNDNETAARDFKLFGIAPELRSNIYRLVLIGGRDITILAQVKLISPGAASEGVKMSRLAFDAPDRGAGAGSEVNDIARPVDGRLGQIVVTLGDAK